jgi:hypothetical protein
MEISAPHSRAIIPLASKICRKPSQAQIYNKISNVDIKKEFDSGEGGREETWIAYYTRCKSKLYTNATTEEKEVVEAKWKKAPGAHKKGMKIEIDEEGLAPDEILGKGENRDGRV